MKIIAALAGVLACGLMAAPTHAQIKEFQGKWTINKSKSQGPQAATEILTYEINGDEEHYIVDEVETDGRKFNTEYRARFDGKEYPNKNLVTGEVNYVKLRKVFDRTEQLTNIKHQKGPDGKETSVVTGYYIRVLAADGKSISSTLIDANGQVTAVRIFDKIEGGANAMMMKKK